VTFRSARNGVDNIFWQPVDGGAAERLKDSKIVQFPLSWHPQGTFLAYREFGAQTGSDIWMLPVSGDDASGGKPGKATLFLGSRFEETAAAFSPDGRWVAYETDESGRNEVYVSPFPEPKRRWQISSGGGSNPRWSAATKELFFIGADQRMMVATYSLQGDAFQAEKPRRVSDTIVNGFDIHPDGQRLAVVVPQQSASSSTSGKVVLILNYADELRRLVPAAR
jgi:Tol biopolymer transport system component